MFCPKCGANLPNESEFCSNCGNSLKKFSSFISQQHQPNNVKKRKIKKYIIFIMSSLVVFAVILVAVIIYSNSNNTNNMYSDVSQKKELSYSYSEGDIPKFIDGTFSNKKISSSEDVLEALEDIRSEMQFKNISKELKFSSSEVSENFTYYKYDQIYEGIPVYNQNIIVSVDKNGKIVGLSGYYIPNINVEISTGKNEEEIRKVVLEELGENSHIESIELNVLANYNSQQLVYVVIGYSDTKAVEYLIDANNSEILEEVNLFDYSSTFPYTGLGMDNQTFTINLEEYFDVFGGAKNRYNFYDPERKISIADYRYIGQYFGTIISALPGTTPIVVDINNGKIDMTFENEQFIQSAITAMANYEKIYDYYKDVLGRNSFDNKGSKIIINLGLTAQTFSGEDLNNAFWSSISNQMFIGNWEGKSMAASLDVLAHEFTHGVVSFTAKFAHSAKDKNKAFETGALNEGYADIIGHLIEGKNWTMAENNKILRDAANPEKYSEPNSKGGKYYYPDGYLQDGRTLEQFLKDNNIKSVYDYDKGGIHDNSNVVSHAAYLMYKAGAFSNREEMAKVWYNSLFMLSSYSNFEDCALAVIKTAKNLGLNNDSIYEITKAFQDTNMLESNNNAFAGIISSGSQNLKNAKVEVSFYGNSDVFMSTTTNDAGEFYLEVPTGIYEIKVTLKDFRDFSTVVSINSKTTLDITLASNKSSDIINSCKGSDCVYLSIYLLNGTGDYEIKEISKIYKVDRGTILYGDEASNVLNQIFGDNIVFDGETFSIRGIPMSLMASYYKDTDIKFDWTAPLNEDAEIELKYLDGLIDYDTILEISKMFGMQ